MRPPAGGSVAPLRVVASTLALLYGTGGLTAELAAWGTAAAGSGVIVMLTVGLVAQAVAVAILRWGPGWPERVLHLLIAAGSGLIAVVIAASPDIYTAVLAGAIATFVGVIASFFIDPRVAGAHIAFTVLISSAALTWVRVPWATLVGLQVLVLTLAVVTRTLVLRAATAELDPLTGLANRRAFDDALTHLGSPSRRPLSAALLDLDHFKLVNDEHGHDSGDALLRRVADCWAGAVPPGAVLARHGGDEFALLLPGLTGPAATELVQGLCDLLPDVSVSAGVAEHLPIETTAQLMRRADLALYRVKDNGRGSVALHADSTAPDTQGHRLARPADERPAPTRAGQPLQRATPRCRDQ